MIAQSNKSTQPNFELLKDAYQIIGGIPAKAFNLDEIVKSQGKSLTCGTIACAIGWLSMHPIFSEILKAKKRKQGGFNWIVKGVPEDYYADAAAFTFNISVKDARNLFTFRYGSDFDDRIPNVRKISDKALFLKRMEMFLKYHGQLKKDT